MISEQVLTRAGMNRARVSDVRAGSAFEFEPETFRRCFNRKPFVVRHNLTDHPLFRLPRLIELARSLPQEFVEYNAGNIPVSIDSRLTPGNGLSVEETIRRIEEHCSWMVLKRVEHDPEYNELLTRCLDEVESLSEPLDPGMYNRAGSVFISSPGSVTPYHIDHEYNFLLQIRGRKTLSVFDGGDRSILAEEDLENHFSGPGLHRNIVFKEDYQRAANVFDLTPGEALHVPATAPHWVKNGPAVSISFSVNFYTSATDRSRGVHNINSRLRRLGIKPAPAGRSAARDSIKYGAFRAIRRASSLFGRSSD